VEWSARGSIGGVEVTFEPGEPSLGGQLEAFEVIPPALAVELVFAVAPYAAPCRS
jgi:hypothetical protein